jgi:hypothetical protein
MKKAVLISIVVLLALSMTLISPAKSKKTVETYQSHVEAELMDPGKQWISEEGILHVKNSYWKGTEEISAPGNLGTAVFEEWYNSLSLDMATGEGTLTVKWKLTFPEGTIEGSARAIITQGYLVSGTFVGTHGTGDFESVKKMGSIEGMLLDPTHMQAEISGIIVFP